MPSICRSLCLPLVLGCSTRQKRPCWCRRMEHPCLWRCMNQVQLRERLWFSGRAPNDGWGDGDLGHGWSTRLSGQALDAARQLDRWDRGSGRVPRFVSEWPMNFSPRMYLRGPQRRIKCLSTSLPPVGDNSNQS